MNCRINQYLQVEKNGKNIFKQQLEIQKKYGY